MIGDFVKISYNGEVGQVYRIDMANGKGNEYAAVNGGDRSCEDLVPIPLTLEILEKNGWEYEFDKKKYMVRNDLGKEGKNCWMMWSIDEKTLDILRQDADLRDIQNPCVQRVVIPCEYVHELQHALKLCGIEKEIVL